MQPTSETGGVDEKNPSRFLQKNKDNLEPVKNKGWINNTDKYILKLVAAVHVY